MINEIFLNFKSENDNLLIDNKTHERHDDYTQWKYYEFRWFNCIRWTYAYNVFVYMETLVVVLIALGTIYVTFIFMYFINTINNRVIEHWKLKIENIILNLKFISVCNHTWTENIYFKVILWYS